MAKEENKSQLVAWCASVTFNLLLASHTDSRHTHCFASSRTRKKEKRKKTRKPSTKITKVSSMTIRDLAVHTNIGLIVGLVMRACRRDWRKGKGAVWPWKSNDSLCPAVIGLID